MITEGHKPLLHHMSLYACKDTFNPRHLYYTGLCSGPDVPSSVRDCHGMSGLYSWGRGAEVRYYFQSNENQNIFLNNICKVIRIIFLKPINPKYNLFIIKSHFCLYEGCFTFSIESKIETSMNYTPRNSI